MNEKAQENIKERLGDTVVFRSYNVALLIQIRERLDRLIELIEGEEKVIQLTEEQLRDALEEFGTTD